MRKNSSKLAALMTGFMVLLCTGGSSAYAVEDTYKQSTKASVCLNKSTEREKVTDSPYFKHPDFYNMKSSGSLTILHRFKTSQQSTEWSCGPCSALMVLNFYGITDWKELKIAEIMGSRRLPDNLGLAGTSTDMMVKFFNNIGFEVSSSLSRAKLPGGFTFSSEKDFRDWALLELKEGTPIMVEFVDWGGHWEVIIGYDTMGTDTVSDDVLIFADPYDTTDHLQDGYFIYPAERFYYMWFDGGLLPRNQSKQQWVIARPRKGKV